MTLKADVHITCDACGNHLDYEWLPFDSQEHLPEGWWEIARREEIPVHLCKVCIPPGTLATLTGPRVQGGTRQSRN